MAHLAGVASALLEVLAVDDTLVDREQVTVAVPFGTKIDDLIAVEATTARRPRIPDRGMSQGDDAVLAPIVVEDIVACRRDTTTAPGSGTGLPSAGTQLEGLGGVTSNHGAVAQLGEHLLCKQEVTGSIPVGSTYLSSYIISLLAPPYVTSTCPANGLM